MIGFWHDRCLICGWSPAGDEHECVETAQPLGLGPGGLSWEDLAEAVGLVADTEDEAEGETGEVPG